VQDKRSLSAGNIGKRAIVIDNSLNRHAADQEEQYKFEGSHPVHCPAPNHTDSKQEHPISARSFHNRNESRTRGLAQAKVYTFRKLADGMPIIIVEKGHDIRSG
jgi:hypothetical protein